MSGVFVPEGQEDHVSPEGPIAEAPAVRCGQGGLSGDLLLEPFLELLGGEGCVRRCVEYWEYDPEAGLRASLDVDQPPDYPPSGEGCGGLALSLSPGEEIVYFPLGLLPFFPLLDELFVGLLQRFPHLFGHLLHVV